MAIRIDITSEDPETVVHVAGRLVGVAVAELTKACDPLEGAWVLDLSGLRSADAAGVEVIRTLSEKGAKLRGASPFVCLLLDDAPGEKSNREQGES